MCTALRLARAQWYYLILIRLACDCLHELTADSSTFAVLARQFIFKFVNYTHFVWHSCVQFRYTIKDKPNQLELWHWSVKEYLYQHREICDMFSIFSKIMNMIENLILLKDFAINFTSKIKFSYGAGEFFTSFNELMIISKLL